MIRLYKISEEGDILFKRFTSEQEKDALADGWKESPADLKTPKAKETLESLELDYSECDYDLVKEKAKAFGIDTTQHHKKVRKSLIEAIENENNS